jgi:hypothetical protein
MMTTTGIFTTHYVEIPVTDINKPIYLIPFGDIHRSSDMCDVVRWQQFLVWAKSKKKAYFLGMGDYDDLASTTERKVLGNRDLHESTKNTIEGIYETHTNRLFNEIKFMKGRLIGLLEGNHYGEFSSGITTTQYLALKLGAKYLGVSSFIRLSFLYQRKRLIVDVWAHHGKGAARLIGGSLNRVQQMGEAAEADIYCMGHDHKKSVGMTTKLKLTTGNGKMRLIHKKQLYARTGSFLKAYENDKQSYIVDGAMNPTDLGVVKIELTPKRKQEKNEDRFSIDIHASI